MCRALLFFVLICTSLTAEIYEGWFPWSNKSRIKMLAHCLPYNSKGLIIGGEGSGVFDQCREAFPAGAFLELPPKANIKKVVSVDYLVVDYGKFELVWLKNALKFFPQLKSIYIKTQHSANFIYLHKFLAQEGYILVARWYEQGLVDEAIFIRRDLYEGYVNALNYSELSIYNPPIYKSQISIENYLKPANNKGSSHSFQSIDFIYMINLDERPEKFKIGAGGLERYGINPYRFSAVNGWKLPHNIVDAVGLRFTFGFPKEKYLALVYRQEQDKEYPSYEFIQDPNASYFCFGLTRGGIGIVLSHISVLYDALKSGYNTIWVMEDDVKVIRDPQLLPELMNQLDDLDPNWDILFTDRDTKDRQGFLVPCRAVAMRPNYPLEPLQAFMSKFYQVSKDISRTGMRYGAYSMIVRRSGMEKILQYYKTYSIFLPYDTDIWLIPDLRMYTANYDIVSTIPDAITDNGKPNYK